MSALRDPAAHEYILGADASERSRLLMQSEIHRAQAERSRWERRTSAAARRDRHRSRGCWDARPAEHDGGPQWSRDRPGQQRAAMIALHARRTIAEWYLYRARRQPVDFYRHGNRSRPARSRSRWARAHQPCSALLIVEDGLIAVLAAGSRSRKSTCAPGSVNPLILPGLSCSTHSTALGARPASIRRSSAGGSASSPRAGLTDVGFDVDARACNWGRPLSGAGAQVRQHLSRADRDRRVYQRTPARPHRSPKPSFTSPNPIPTSFTRSCSKRGAESQLTS